MDSQNWVGNMFQRFEDVFHEVDEFVNNDTVKFVENHMQSVGESVKNFCNGVVQDMILPPLIETYRNAIDNNTKKLEEGPLIPTENSHKLSPTSEISESPVEEEEDNNPNPNFQHEVINNTSYEEERVVYDTISERSDSVIEDVIDLNVGIEEKSERVSMETKISDEFESDMNTSRIQDSCEIKSLISCNENKEEKLSDILLSAKSYDSLSTGGYFSASSQDLSSCESLDHDNNYDSSRFGYSTFTLTDETTHELDSSIVDYEDLDLDTIDLTDKEEIVESCVIVEGEKLFSFPYGSGRSKSYKKIIRDAFMSKKKLTEEYKLLAIWCGDVDKERNATKSQVQDFPDSEWELL